MSKTKRKVKQELNPGNTNPMPIEQATDIAAPAGAIQSVAAETIEPDTEDEEIEPEILPSRGNLIAHCGATKIGFDQLKLIAAPEATRTHKPVAHHTIVEALLETLSFRHISCIRSEFAVSPDGMKMFGILDLDAEFNGCRFAIGIRNSHDKSMRLAMTVGFRVVVCDNMAFQGDFSPVLAKHSKSLNLIDSISIGVDKIQRNFEPLKAQVHKWQQEYLRNEEAKLIIYAAFIEGKLKAPNSLMPLVHKLYFKPEYEEFKDPTLWSLSNAFTSAFKTLLPIRQFQVTAKLGSFIEQFVNPY